MHVCLGACGAVTGNVYSGFVLQCSASGRVNVFLVSTYTEGSPPESAKWFCQWLFEAVDDFRVQKSLLSGVRFAVFGLGNSLYSDHYNTVGKDLFDGLSRLSGTPVFSLGLGDQNVAESVHGGQPSSTNVVTNCH